MSDSLFDRDFLEKNEKKKKKILESHIERPACDYARNKHGMKAEKFSSPMNNSVPDRKFTTKNGFIFYIEFKAPKKTPTENQHLDHLERREMNVFVFWTDNLDEAKEIIDWAANVTVTYNF